MKLLGIEHTKREAIYLFLILILLIGFLLNIWAFERDDFTRGYEHGYSLQDGTHG